MRRRAEAGHGIFNTTSRAAANRGSAMDDVRWGESAGSLAFARASRFAGTWVAVLGTLGTLGPATSALAFRAIDAPPPTRAAVLNAPQAAPALQADDRNSLRQGVVGAVSTNGDAVLVNGAWFVIVEGRTQVFRDGRPAPPGALAKGQVVKFTLAPGTPDQKTLGVVYVP